MLEINQLLKDKEFTLKSDGTLFGIDPLVAVKDHKCPYCYRRLYPMMSKPFVYCRNKSHKSFIMGKNKLK